MRRRARGIALSAVVALVPLALPSAGVAATITLGETGAGTPTCLAITLVQDQTAPASPSYTVPAAGEITAWSHEAGPDDGGGPQLLRLKVYRRTGAASDFFTVGQSNVETLTDSSLNTFSVSPIQVQAGDLLGLAIPAGSDSVRCVHLGVSGDTIRTDAGDPAPGTTATFGGLVIGRANVSATLVTDDTGPQLSLGGKKKQGSAGKVKVEVTCADEACMAEAEGTLKTPKPRLAVAAGRKSELKPSAAQLAAGETQTLTLKVKKKAKKQVKKGFKAGKKSKATLEVTATDAIGNQSQATRKVKLKK